MDPNDVCADIFYDDDWHDLVAGGYLRQSDPITISPRGRPDESSRAPASKAGLSLLNPDGRFSPRNTASPLFRKIGRNTPLRIGLGRATLFADTFTRSVTDGVGTSSSGHTYITEGTAANFDVTGSALTIQPSALNSNRLAYVDTDYVDADETGTFTLNALPASGAMNYGLVAGTVDGSNRYGGLITVASSGAATLALQVVVGGSGLQFDTQASGLTIVAGTAYKIRFQLRGEWATVRVWLASGDMPTSGAQVFSGRMTGLDYAGKRVGVFVRNETAATTHVVTIDNLSTEPHWRFHGEIETWPQRSNVTGSEVWVPIEAWGIRRRLNAPGTTAPVHSPLSRAYLNSIEAGDDLVAWWPLEDGNDATFGGSGLDHGQPTSPIIAPAVFGSTPIGASGAASGVDFSQGGYLEAFTGQAVAAAPDGYEFEFVVAWDALPAIPTSETWAIAHAVAGKSGAVSIMGVGLRNDAGTIKWANYIFDVAGGGSISTTTLDPPVANRTYHVRVKCTQEGAGVRILIVVDGESDSAADGFDETLMMPNRLLLNVSPDVDNPDWITSPKFLSALAFYTPARTTAETYLAGDGYQGEPAAERLERLCGEENITIEIRGDASASEPMGVQRVAQFTDLLNDCEEADGGVLFEPRDFLGFVYRTFATFLNQPITATLDYAAGGQIAPELIGEEDTEHTANDVTVTRYQGASARRVKTSGTLNVNPPTDDPDGVGRYQKDYTLVLATDDRAAAHAGWLLNVGTFDDLRYPAIVMELAAMREEGNLSALIAQVLALDVADRIAISSLPAWFPPYDASQIVQGFAEVIGTHTHTITANATPEGAFRVGLLDSTAEGRMDCNGSTVGGGGIDDNDTSITIEVTDTCLWSTTAEPYDLNINGEQVTVTSMSGASSPQTATVTRSVNGAVMSHPAGTEIHIWQPFRLAR